MKKAILTFGLFSLVMVLTSFTTPETSSPEIIGGNAAGGNVKLDIIGGNAAGGNVKLDDNIIGGNAAGGNVKLDDIIGGNAAGGNVKLD
jgi:hypothetical protein